MPFGAVSNGGEAAGPSFWALAIWWAALQCNNEDHPVGRLTIWWADPTLTAQIQIYFLGDTLHCIVNGFHVKIVNNLLWNALTDSERGWTTMKPWPHIPFYFLAIFWQGGWSNQTPECLGRRKTVDLNSTVDWADGWGGSAVVLIRKVPVIWSERTLGHQKDSGIGWLLNDSETQTYICPHTLSFINFINEKGPMI